jgi:hypothetical protein
MKFEIVNHCYRYGRLLAYQLSSLVLYPPPRGHSLTYTLCYDPDDKPVADTLEFFAERLLQRTRLNLHPLSPGLIRNRAWGRNRAARLTKADWVWFADTDYFFGEMVWPDLINVIESGRIGDATFLAPLRIWETDWPTGDQLIRDMDTLDVRDVDAEGLKCAPVRKSVAIGGLQIAYGTSVRRIGYAPEIAKRGESLEWDFKSDIRFRNHPEMSSKAEVYLRDLVRIRHTNKGYGQANRHEVVN